MLAEFKQFDPTAFTDKQIEKIMLDAQDARLKARAQGKYDAMIFVLKMFPDLRANYGFGRMFDDQADGDEPLPLGFETLDELSEHLIDVARGKVKPERGFRIDFLLQRCVKRLEVLSEGKDDIPLLVEEFVRGMKAESDSRIQRTIYDEYGLARLYRQSFEPAQDIALICLGAKKRSVDIPELSQIQGRSYSISDLETDLGNGIIRIPRSVVVSSNLSVDYLCREPENSSKNPAISEWIADEIQGCKELKNILFQRPMDFKTQIFCRFLTFKS